MKQNFDFHVHTTASDGSLTPSAVIKKARAENITTIGITDHDTIKGVEEAVRAGKKEGVEVLSGVEISIDFSPGTMHLCGYCIDIKNRGLSNRLDYLQEGRLKRNIQIINKLKALGVAITMDEVVAEAGKEELGRPHFAKVMVKKGFVKDTQEAFDKYLAKGAPCYMDRLRLGLEEAVDVITGAGGIVVLAHPAQLQLKDQQDYKTLFKKLKAQGIVGIEAYSSHQSEEENAMFKSSADEAGLLVTGGSDFHGDTKPDVRLGEFGEHVDIDIDKLLSSMKIMGKKGRKQ